MNADGLSHNYYNMDKKDIQKKIEKWKRPSLKIHYLEKVLKNPRLLRKETRIAAIDILAGLNSQVEDYLNSAFLYEKIGKNKEAIDQLRMASKFGSSNDSPLKSYEKAAKELEKKGHKEYAKKYGYEPPWLLLISPTMKCNLNCIGCSTREFNSRDDLPLEEMDRILTEAKRDMGIYFIVTLGGEMLTRPDLFDFWKKHNDVFFQVYTNGTLIDKKVAKKLAAVGNVAPMLSVEGFEKETDARRGKGVWQKIMLAMDNLKTAGVPFGYSCTMTRYNAELIISDKFMDFMIDKG